VPSRTVCGRQSLPGGCRRLRAMPDSTRARIRSWTAAARRSPLLTALEPGHPVDPRDRRPRGLSLRGLRLSTSRPPLRSSSIAISARSDGGDAIRPLPSRERGSEDATRTAPTGRLPRSRSRSLEPHSCQSSNSGARRACRDFRLASHAGVLGDAGAPVAGAADGHTRVGGGLPASLSRGYWRLLILRFPGLGTAVYRG
jgi:hypothetical protein